MESLIGLLIFAVIAVVSGLVKLNEKRRKNVLTDTDMRESIANPDEDQSS